jgi:hypothetical protein
MGLMTNDVSVLFETFEKVYGNQWKQRADAVPVWREKMKSYTAEDLTVAVEKAIDIHKNHPPTLGQFMDCLRSGRGQYNPRPQIEGPQLSPVAKLANKVMIIAVMASGGVKPLTLRAMISLKNALTEDYEGKNDPDFPKELLRQLTEIRIGYESQAEELEEIRI